MFIVVSLVVGPAGEIDEVVELVGIVRRFERARAADRIHRSAA